MESKKNIKKRFGIEGLAMNNKEKYPGMQNFPDDESEDAMEILEKVQGPNYPENTS